MFGNCFVNELIKLKRSGVLWLATAGSVMTNLMFVGTAMALTVVKTDLIKGDPLESWSAWITFHYNGILPMLLPMFLVILCALAVNQEKRYRTWTALAVLPVPPQFIYLAKLFGVACVFVLSHLLFIVLLVLLPFVLQLSLVDSMLNARLVVQLFTSTVLTSLGIISLVYLVSYFSRNFILPLAVGILGFVLSQLLHDNAIQAWFFPFSLPVDAMDEILTSPGIPWKLAAISTVFFAGVTLGGALLARRAYPRM